MLDDNLPFNLDQIAKELNIVKKYKVFGFSFEIDRIKLTGKSEESVTMIYWTLWTFSYYRPTAFVFNLAFLRNIQYYVSE